MLLNVRLHHHCEKVKEIVKRHVNFCGTMPLQYRGEKRIPSARTTRRGSVSHEWTEAQYRDTPDRIYSPSDNLVNKTQAPRRNSLTGVPVPSKWIKPELQ